MKNLKNTTYVILLTLLTLMAGCSSDDNNNNNNPDDDTDDPIGEQGDPHTYDFTITSGSAGEEHVSGEIENVYYDEVTNISGYSILEDDTKKITLFIGNNEINIIGGFYETNGQTTDFGSGNETYSDLTIVLSPPLEDGYYAISGSVELSNVNYKSLTSTDGFASFKLTFNGTFDTDDFDETVQISGTVVVHMPPSYY